MVRIASAGITALIGTQPPANTGSLHPNLGGDWRSATRAAPSKVAPGRGRCSAPPGELGGGDPIVAANVAHRGVAPAEFRRPIAASNGRAWPQARGRRRPSTGFLPSFRSHPLRGFDDPLSTALSLRFMGSAYLTKPLQPTLLIPPISSVGPLQFSRAPRQTSGVLSSAQVGCHRWRPGSTFGEARQFER